MLIIAEGKNKPSVIVPTEAETPDAKRPELGGASKQSYEKKGETVYSCMRSKKEPRKGSTYKIQ